MNDVVVVGAGPAGSTAAALLARRGLAVALLDRAVFPRDKPCAEFLSPGTVAALREVGLGEAVEGPGRFPLHGFVVFTPDGGSFRASYGDRVGTSAAGRAGVAVPRWELDHALLQAAEAAGATVRQGAQVTGLSHAGGWPLLSVRLRDGGVEYLAARLVIAADGVGSAIGRRLGLVRRAGPRRIALVTHLEGIEGLGPYGEMHVGLGGYCGVAPISPALANVALVVDAKEGGAVRGRPEAYLAERLRTFPALSPRVRGARQVGSVLAVGPMAYRARRASAEGVLLVGDAAGFFDPLTGQGMYRAVRSAVLAAKVAADALAEMDTSAGRLAEYDRRRREFRGQDVVERIVQAVAARPRLLRRVSDRLARRRDLADRLLGVTGDVRPARDVLNPAYVARLLW